jgi:Zn-dependent protease with chaperone function
MTLEPLVLDRIKHHRRATKKLKIAIFAIAVISIILNLASVTYAVYLVASSDDVDLSALFILVALAIGVLTLVDTMIFLAIRGTKLESHFVAHRLDPEQHQYLAYFKDGLQGSSLAVGTNPPPLKVVDIKGVSTLSINLENGRPTVVLTPDALNAGLTKAEAEAIMAHELSHILIGDEVFIVAKSRFDLFMWSALLLTVAFGMMSMMLSAMAKNSFIWYATPCCLSAVFLLCFLGVKLLSQRSSHDDLLADSIASKITNNPGALKSAISKLAQLDMLGTVLRSILSGGNSPLLDQAIRNELPIDKETPMAMVPMRIKNLEAIENGHWPVLEQ